MISFFWMKKNIFKVFDKIVLVVMHYTTSAGILVGTLLIDSFRSWVVVKDSPNMRIKIGPYKIDQ